MPSSALSTLGGKSISTGAESGMAHERRAVSGASGHGRFYAKASQRGSDLANTQPRRTHDEIHFVRNFFSAASRTRFFFAASSLVRRTASFAAAIAFCRRLASAAVTLAKRTSYSAFAANKSANCRLSSGRRCLRAAIRKCFPRRGRAGGAPKISPPSWGPAGARRRTSRGRVPMAKLCPRNPRRTNQRKRLHLGPRFAIRRSNPCPATYLWARRAAEELFGPQISRGRSYDNLFASKRPPEAGGTIPEPSCGPIGRRT